MVLCLPAPSDKFCPSLATTDLFTLSIVLPFPKCNVGFLIIYFYIFCIFVAVRELSLVAASGDYSLVEAQAASHCDGFSCHGAQVLGLQ